MHTPGKRTIALRQASIELREFMKQNNMSFSMTLKIFLEMVALWSEVDVAS